MAVELGQQVWRRDLLSRSTWQLEVLAKQPGDYVLVIPIRLDTFWERYIGGQLWVRATLTGSELRCFLDIAQHGGILAKNPEHIWVSLSQGASRLVSGMEWNESLAFTTIMPLFFYKYYCKSDEGCRSWVRFCTDCVFGGSAQRLHEPHGDVLERRDFERQFQSLAPDGVFYSPWDVEGGYGESFTRYFWSSSQTGVERRRVRAAMDACPIYVPLLGRILPNDYCTANGTVPGRADGPFDGQSEDEPTGSEDGHSDDGGDSPGGSGGEHRTGKRDEVPSQPGDEGEQGGPGFGNGPHDQAPPDDGSNGGGKGSKIFITITSKWTIGSCRESCQTTCRTTKRANGLK